VDPKSRSLRLYVSGQDLSSRVAIRNLEPLQAAASVEVVDVRERPELAEEDGILATPTLVRLRPAPVRKVVGDLSDAERVLVALELEPEATA
jgi:circadian clock protein KaiB